MCWLLVAGVVAVLGGVGQPHQSVLLHLVAAAVVVEEEQNCGFPLYLLALLKQSLWVLVALAALLELLTIQPAHLPLTAAIPPLGLGRLLEVEVAVLAAQQLLELPELVAGDWEKVLQGQQVTPHLAGLETQQAVVPLAVEVIDPVAVAVLLDLQRVQLLLVTGKLVEKAGHS